MLDFYHFYLSYEHNLFLPWKLKQFYHKIHFVGHKFSLIKQTHCVLHDNLSMLTYDGQSHNEGFV